MQDTELYRQLLGLSAPWKVVRVELDVPKQRVDVWTDHEDATWTCPECGREAGLYDHSEERAWRHLDSCQFQTYLHARPPRVKCPEHGVRQVQLPWAEGRARFTLMFERFAIDVLSQTDVSGATRILRISWDEAWHILERAVRRGLASKQQQVCRYIGVDETASARGQRYVTVVCDLEAGTVEHVKEDRKVEGLASYYSALSDEQRVGIEAIAMDMWTPYLRATRDWIADAEHKMVYDRFHVMQHVGLAVDIVRKSEHKALRAEGDDTLVGSKYFWLYSAENLPEKYEDRFAALRRLNLKTGRAWALKESLRELWSYRSPFWAMRYWKRWHNWATHSQLKPMIRAAATVKRFLQPIFNFFRHRITNAVAEGLNSKIQAVKRMANGFRNTEHFKTAIYFHCGGLQLHPTHGEA